MARMDDFQLVGLPDTPFAGLFTLPDDALARMNARRIVATESHGYPCRVSLEDARAGEELILLPFEHQPAATPYRASGPIFVRRGARQAILPAGHVPPYVATRLMSLRAYDGEDLIVSAEVLEGADVASALDRFFADGNVAYVHLHNARRGCYSCLARRA